MVKNLTASAGDIKVVSSVPGSGRSPGAGHGNPLPYSCLENPMDRAAKWATVRRVPRVGYDELSFYIIYIWHINLKASK